MNHVYCDQHGNQRGTVACVHVCDLSAKRVVVGPEDVVCTDCLDLSMAEDAAGVLPQASSMLEYLLVICQGCREEKIQQLKVRNVHFIGHDPSLPEVTGT